MGYYEKERYGDKRGRNGCESRNSTDTKAPFVYGRQGGKGT